jgi:hypothetical protein
MAGAKSAVKLQLQWRRAISKSCRPIDGDEVNVVVETSKGKRFKFKYDSQ